VDVSIINQEISRKRWKGKNESEKGNGGESRKRRFGWEDNQVRKIDNAVVVIDFGWLLSWLKNHPAFSFERDQLLDRGL